jgi:hypothetical protein
VHDVLRSPGQPLDEATRAFMEPRFGYDFSQVRIHNDAQAAESARMVNALAYTIGANVTFAEGKYQPTRETGRRLLAHELTHVMQQTARPSRSPGTSLKVGAQATVPSAKQERVADLLLSRGTAPPSIAPPYSQVAFAPALSDSPQRLLSGLTTRINFHQAACARERAAAAPRLPIRPSTERAQDKDASTEGSPFDITLPLLVIRGHPRPDQGRSVRLLSRNARGLERAKEAGFGPISLWSHLLGGGCRHRPARMRYGRPQHGGR